MTIDDLVAKLTQIREPSQSGPPPRLAWCSAPIHATTLLTPRRQAYNPPCFRHLRTTFHRW